MPSTLIPVPQFPSVPALPGVPQLARSGLDTPPNDVSLGPQTQSTVFGAVKAGPAWAILDANNTPVVVPDSFLNFDARSEYKISDYPVQQGSFSSYNKVVIPFDVSVRFSKAGNLAARAAFLKSIDDIAGDTNLYTVVTPEKAYLSCNITRYEVTRRGAEGAYFLCEVDVYFRQILQVAAQYSTTAANTANAQNPAAVGAQNRGNLLPAPPPVPGAALASATAAIRFTPH